MAGKGERAARGPRLLNNLLGISGRRLATVALVLLSASMAVNFGELIVRGAEVQQKIEKQRELNQAHRAEKEHLEALLSYYQSPVHVEMVAREQLGYAREGDVVLLPQFVAAPPVEPSAPADAPPATAPTPAALPTPTPNLVRWWQAYFPAPDS
jgi:cell division protein FtsB